jgi:hypothetical protein
MKISRKKIAEILGVYYVSPHSSIEEREWNHPRCGDCFCTIQKVHTHNGKGEEQLKAIISLLRDNQTP